MNFSSANSQTGTMNLLWRLGERNTTPANSNRLLGWRKAKRCQRLVRRVQCRLKVLKNKRVSMARQLREDVAQLIKTGHKESATDRAGRLFKDECIIDVYGLLDRFCQVILMHLSYARQGRVCPGDIEEAVSSLVFASERCRDLPELLDIRRLFGELYGDSFTKGALELCPGNLVNQKIREKLCVKSVPYDVKRRLVDEICRDHACSITPEILALGYEPDQLQTEVECSLEIYPCYGHESDDSEDGTKKKQLESPAEQDKTCSDIDAVVYNVFTYPGYEPSKRNAMVTMKPIETSSVSESETDSSSSGDKDDRHSKHVHPKLPDYDDIAAEFSARKEEYVAILRIMAAANKESGPVSESETDSSGDQDDQLGLPETYSRAMSLPPPERPKEKIPRSNSCPSQRPKYVHPKLPDYDDITAAFSARKREYMAQCRARIVAAAAAKKKGPVFYPTIEYVCIEE